MCLRKALLSDSVVVWRNLRSSSVCSWAPLQAIRVGSFLDLSHPKSWGADLTGKQISQVRWLASRQQESASLYLSLHASLLFLFKFWVLATLNRSQGTQRGFKLSWPENAAGEAWSCDAGWVAGLIPWHSLTCVCGVFLPPLPAWWKDAHFQCILFTHLHCTTLRPSDRPAAHVSCPPGPQRRLMSSVHDVDTFALRHYECLSFWFLTDWLKPFGSNQISHLPESEWDLLHTWSI